MATTYQCAICQGIYEGVPVEEAEAEGQTLWGVAHASQDPAMIVICDDCFHAPSAGERLAMAQAYRAVAPREDTL